MKKEICVELKNETYCMISGITFAQVPYWFPFYNYHDLKMNMIRPFEPGARKRPLVLWICGGAWITMDRNAHTPYLMEYVKHGYIVASIEYRLSNSACYPAQLQDVKSAIRYLRAHADAYGIDAERIAVMGESAGGYLASMAGVTSDRTEFDAGENLTESSSVQAVVDFYGPSHFAEEGRSNPEGKPFPDQMLLGYSSWLVPERAKETDVTSYINEKTPPFFIVHGMADPVVSIEQSEYLYDALDEKNIRVEFLKVKDACHAAPAIYQDEISVQIMEFLDCILKK